MPLQQLALNAAHHPFCFAEHRDFYGGMLLKIVIFMGV
jgi:hypothetical protein